jgi:hypothetical protein
MTRRSRACRSRFLPAAALLTLTAVTMTGCVTVHGERALIPALKAPEAAKVLADFARTNNQANRAYDAQLITTIEAGPRGAIDQAGLTASHVTSPAGNRAYTPIKLTDAHFLIPQQRGWPKWFVANVHSSQTPKGRWLLVFERGSANAPWKASYLGVTTQSSLPQFARDKDGYIEPVPVTGSDLLVQPTGLGSAYTGYLQQGSAGSDVFAAGAATSGERAARAKDARSADSVTLYADQPANADAFTPVALRTKDGGALVFFSTRDTEKTTYRTGLSPTVNPYVKALMTGTATHSVTVSRVSEQMVTVPARAAGGKVTFLSQLAGLVTAKGE